MKAMLLQHPDHALYLPAKTFVEQMRTEVEREAMRGGAEKDIVRELLHELFPSQIEGVQARAFGGQAAVVARVPGEVRKTFDAYLIPREVADHLKKAHSMQFDDEATKGFLRVWDKATSWWKIFATITRPGFHVRNALSNFWQMFLGGVTNPGVLLKAAGIMRGKPEAVSNVGRYTAAQAKQLADRYGIFGSGYVTSDIAELVKREIAPSANVLATTGPVARLGAKVGGKIEDHAKFPLFPH